MSEGPRHTTVLPYLVSSCMHCAVLDKSSGQQCFSAPQWLFSHISLGTWQEEYVMQSGKLYCRQDQGLRNLLHDLATPAAGSVLLPKGIWPVVETLIGQRRFSDVRQNALMQVSPFRVSPFRHPSRHVCHVTCGHFNAMEPCRSLLQSCTASARRSCSALTTGCCQAKQLHCCKRCWNLHACRASRCH